MLACDLLQLSVSLCVATSFPSTQQLPIPHAPVILCLQGPFLQHPAWLPWQRQAYPLVCCYSYYKLDLNSSPHTGTHNLGSWPACLCWIKQLWVSAKAKAPIRCCSWINTLSYDWPCFVSVVCMLVMLSLVHQSRVYSITFVNAVKRIKSLACLLLCQVFQPMGRFASLCLMC